MIHIVKVVSRNFIMDYVAKIQNLFGMNITSYERMINQGIEEIQKELKSRGLNLKWFRYETAQLTNGAAMVMLYGEEK